MKKIQYTFLAAFTAFLFIVADTSVSAASHGMWFEPECPEELLK